MKNAEESKITHSLYSQKYKENIPCHKKSEFYFAPRVILKKFNSKVKLGFAGCAMRKCKSFLKGEKAEMRGRANVNYQIVIKRSVPIFIFQNWIIKNHKEE